MKRLSLREILEEKKKIINSLDILSRLENLKLSYHFSMDGLTIEIPFINENIQLDIPSISFRSKERKRIETVEKILILNHIIYAEPISHSGKWISLPELLQKQEKDVIRTFYFACISDRDLIKKAISLISGDEICASTFIIYIFPTIPVILKLNDDGVKVFFDDSLKAYKQKDDLLSILKILSRKIINKARYLYEQTSF